MTERFGLNAEIFLSIQVFVNLTSTLSIHRYGKPVRDQSYCQNRCLPLPAWVIRQFAASAEAPFCTGSTGFQIVYSPLSAGNSMTHGIASRKRIARVVQWKRSAPKSPGLTAWHLPGWSKPAQIPGTGFQAAVVVIVEPSLIHQIEYLLHVVFDSAQGNNSVVVSRIGCTRIVIPRLAD